MEFEKLITEKQAAQLLAISEGMMRKSRRSGKLVLGFHYTKIGTAVRYSPTRVYQCFTEDPKVHAHRVADFLSGEAAASGYRGAGRPRRKEVAAK